MTINDEKFWIVFNGEIYNFEWLRKELTEEGVTFKSSSDTEVILQLYSRYGGNVSRSCGECLPLLYGITAKIY